MGVKIDFRDYLESLNQTSEAAAVQEIFLDAMSDLGFIFAALTSHVDLADPPEDTVLIHRYPNGWFEHFSEKHYGLIDPVFHKAQLAGRPFFWEETTFLSGLTSKQTQILNEGKEFGINNGFTIPIHSPGVLSASCSLIPAEEGVDPLHYPLAHSMAIFAHGRLIDIFNAQNIRCVPKLSHRQKQYLQLAAEGKTEWEMAQILHVSESAAHGMIRRIRNMFGVTTRTQAVALAVRTQQIDVLR